MTVKCTGVEFNQFVTSLPEGVWFDDFGCTINGFPDELSYSFKDGEAIPEDAEVVIFGGELHDDPDNPRTFHSLEHRLARWLRQRKFITLVIEVPNGKVAAIKSLIEPEGVVIRTETVV